ESPIKTARGDDIRVPVPGNGGLSDRLFFRDGKLNYVTAATPDPRYPNREEILKKFGTPEARTRFQTQECLEYTEKGLRFHCAAAGKKIGIVYLPATPRRVPEGYPNNDIDLRRNLPAPIPGVVPADFRVGTARVSINPERFDNLTRNGKEKPLH